MLAKLDKLGVQAADVAELGRSKFGEVGLHGGQHGKGRVLSAKKVKLSVGSRRLLDTVL
jgi:hypothetical protein